MPSEKRIKKSEIKIPVRLISRDPVYRAAPKTITEKPSAKPPVKRAIKAEKKQPPIKNINQQKKKLYTLVCIFSVAIFVGWLFYNKGSFKGSLWDSVKLKAAKEELTNAFQNFGRAFSNVQKLDNNASSQSVEEFEKRVFPQFIKSQ